jgi:hypothetical protein
MRYDDHDVELMETLPCGGSRPPLQGYQHPLDEELSARKRLRKQEEWPFVWYGVERTRNGCGYGGQGEEVI